MSNHEHTDWKRLLRRFLLAIVLVVGAGALGLWVGELSVPDDLPEYQGIDGLPARQSKSAKATPEELSSPVPPLYFFAGSVENADLPVVLEEVKLAMGAGIDQIILPVQLDWESESREGFVRALLEQVIAVNPRARLFLQFRLDPTKAWADTRPTEILPGASDDGPHAAPYSELWRDEAARRAAALAKALSQERLGPHVRGYLLSALKNGRWELAAGAKPADCATAAFRAWLRRRYTENEALRAAWGDIAATVESAAVPDEVSPGEGNVFLELPKQQALADYREFLADSVADSIAAVMAALKQAVPGAKVFAQYGHTFEVEHGAQGMTAMGRLLYSDLDGFAGAVSATERGIGGTGGLSGPAFSAVLHQKQWIIIDDTRTGVARDPATGEIARLQGIRAEDVYNVQRRNFSLAAVHGLGLAWADPQGAGWLHAPEQWTEFGHMREIYAALYPPAGDAGGGKGPVAASSEAEPIVMAKTEKKEVEKKSSTKKKTPAKAEKKPEKPAQAPLKETAKPDVKQEAAAPAPEKQDPAKQDPADASPAPAPDAAPLQEAPPGSSGFDQQLEQMLEPAPVGPPDTFKIGLAVVIDENALHSLGNSDLLRERLTLPARDAAMRAGIALRTCLLQDVLDDIAPSAQVYLFINAVKLSAAERDRLHARLQRDQSCAIWCYAPGYLSPLPDKEAVAQTVGMKLEQIDGGQAGSRFTLGGRWLEEGTDIGDVVPVSPLFGINDPEVDLIAEYRNGGKGSIGLRVMPEGWASIYVAEPTLTAALLRELLHLTEKRTYFRLSDRAVYDTALVGLNLIAIHAKQGGEVALSLGNVFNIEDMFDPTIGWPQKESITLPVKTGETRLLRLTPVY